MDKIAFAAVALLLLKSLMDKGSPMDKKRAYVLAAWEAASKVAAEAGWPRDLLITVSALESGWGVSKLTQQANNLFGFKSSPLWINNGGAFVKMPTREIYSSVAAIPKDEELVSTPIPMTVNGKPAVEVMVNARFRKYPSWEDSMRDYTRLVTVQPRYAKASAAAKAGDLPAYFAAIKEGGYATDPEYPAKLAATYRSIETVAV